MYVFFKREIERKKRVERMDVEHLLWLFYFFYASLIFLLSPRPIGKHQKKPEAKEKSEDNSWSDWGRSKVREFAFSVAFYTGGKIFCLFEIVVERIHT